MVISLVTPVYCDLSKAVNTRCIDCTRLLKLGIFACVLVLKVAQNASALLFEVVFPFFLLLPSMN